MCEYTNKILDSCVQYASALEWTLIDEMIVKNEPLLGGFFDAELP